MDDDEALRLNTVHRFRKHSPRLLLEEYSHCEVPAGCGGAVLRWVDPQVGTPAIVRVFAEGEISTWIDGGAIDSGRVDLSAGPHTLALAIVPPKQSRLAAMFSRKRLSPILLLSIVRALGRDDPDRGNQAVLLCSRPNRAWRMTGERPPPSWTAPKFDDSGWSTPSEAELDAEQSGNYRAQQLQGHGAVPLALPPAHAWIRVRFEVPPLRVEERR